MACSSSSLSALPFSLPRARFLQSSIFSFFPCQSTPIPSLARSSFSPHFPTDTGFKFPNASSRLRISCMCHFNKAAVITKDSWEKSVLKSQIPVLVEFYTSWCGPCRMVDRVIDEIAGEYAGRIKCFLLNADNDPKVAEEYDVKAVPVVLLFKNGEKFASVIGTMPKEFYVAAIERVLNS